MTWMELHVFSEAIEMMTTVNVLLPDMKNMTDEPLETLYLLHGYSDDHTAWMRKGHMEDYAEQYRLCVVMPEVAHSFYTDLPWKEKYFTFVSQELPAYLEKLLPLRKDRAGRFVAGLSMGGYGAMKLALSYPDRFAAVACLSGAVWMEPEYQDRTGKGGHLLNLAYDSAEDMAKRGGSITALADKLTKETAPRIYQACGTEDFLYESNQKFFAAHGKRLDITYVTEPGIHNWAFWQRHIQKALEFFGIEKL